MAGADILRKERITPAFIFARGAMSSLVILNLIRGVIQEKSGNVSQF